MNPWAATQPEIGKHLADDLLAVALGGHDTPPSYRQARTPGIGLLSGGYGEEVLESVGAYRAYGDPDELHRHLDELGIRNPSAQ